MNQASAEIIECTHCGARNRIPLDHRRDQAKCGRCQAPLSRENDDSLSTIYVLRCSECAAKNRVSSNKLSDRPKCGKCGARLHTQELLEPQPIMITDHNFHDKVLKSPLPVLVFAMSPTCPSCTMVAPHVEAIAREYRGKIKVGRLNVQSSPGLAGKFNILSVPYLLIFDRGRLQDSLPGGLNKEQFRQLVARYTL